MIINSAIHIFDSIGCSFTVKNGQLVIGSPLKGYKSLDVSHIGSYIPYLLRNYPENKDIEWEVGIGQVIEDTINIKIDRTKIVRSSNNDLMVNLSESNKSEFYIFANESGFNTGFNNVILKDSDFTIDNIQATYLLDSTSNIINGILPEPNNNQNLIIELKIISGDNPIYIKENNGHILFTLNSTDRYVRLVCSGSEWVRLNDQYIPQYYNNAEDNQTFGIMSVNGSGIPGGSSLSIQYNSGGGFDGANIFYGSGNKLLLGSDTEATARAILPSSGNFDTIFDNSSVSGNFIVKSSGDKSLFFTYDGRLGLNIPSGARPQTIFHLVNTICQEGIRLENRNSCHPANITLYHKPNSSISNGSVVSEINLSAKNVDGNKVDYTKIRSKALATSSSDPRGEFSVVVATTATGVELLRINPASAYVGYSSNQLLLTSGVSSVIKASGSSLTITSATSTLTSPAILLQSTNITLGSGNTGSVTVPAVYANSLQSNNINIPNIAANSLLSINSSGFISAASSFAFPAIPSGKILTTSANGSVTGIFNTDSYFLTEKDIIWNRYPKRIADICLRQIVPTTPWPMEEFAVGDQIAVVTNTTTFYRTILSIDYTGNTIVSILVNQNLSENTVSNIKVYSITRGGYLLTQMYVEDGTISDSTSNVFSIRPLTDTVFNTTRKDINFKVYGTEQQPGIYVKASTGTSTKPSGIYYSFATQELDSSGSDKAPFAIPITTGGVGTDNNNNTANYNNIASGSFSGMVSSVGTNGIPSYYNTRDQNGNVAEWIQDSSTVSTNNYQYIAGGSWKTTNVNFLNSISNVVYNSGYNNVGFRICGAYGLNDISYITGTLNMDFVPVNNPSNLADTNGLYVDVTGSLVASGINNLGVVNYNYRIGEYEVTNDQYRRFLNAAAISNIYTLYNTSADSDIIGGIARSGTDGSYSYTAKSNMSDKPVNYVDYLSAIRFTNWLHNGAPTGTGVLATGNAITEDGAYTIVPFDGAYSITKNPYQKYWLPNIHEWHKAAYYEPKDNVETSGTTVVMIRRDDPYLVSSGLYANLSVSGYLYADNILVGNNKIRTSDTSNSVSLVSGIPYSLDVGSPNIVVALGNNRFDGSYGTKFTSSGVQIASSGKMSLVSTGPIDIYSAQPVYMNDLIVKTFKAENVVTVDPNGNPKPTYDGTVGSLLYKKDDTTTGSSDQFIAKNGAPNGGIGLFMGEGKPTSPLYIDNGQYVSTFSPITYLSNKVTIDTDVKVSGIQIGDDLPFFSGSILTHQGIGNAIWEPASYLKAEGVSWTRYPKRNVKIYENRLVFIGSNLETINAEFSYQDTIAVINAETRQTYYVKAANGLFVVDGIPNPTLSTEVFSAVGEGIEVTFCPVSPWPVISGVGVDGYAFAVNRGGYMSMQLEPSATAGFSCDTDTGLDETSPYRFKPSTLNNISIRPGITTAFNLLAEPIDFAIYGAKKTLYNRYEPSLFTKDSSGLPIGLTPAFRVFAGKNDAAIGNISSGVFVEGYLDINKTMPSGYTLDETAKITINRDNPYVIDSIPSGLSSLTTYADLTVDKYIYAGGGVITNEVVLLPDAKYVVNAPLTINNLGQIISVMPTAPPTIPGSPTNVTGQSGNSSIALSWIAPENNGNSTIINYKIEYSINDGNTWTTLSKESSKLLSYNITGLTNGLSYIFRVSAINAVGTSNPSQVSSSIVPSNSLPSAPRNLAVSRVLTTATLSWVVPITVGDSAINDYHIEFSTDSGLSWINAPNDVVAIDTSFIINGILPGPTYSFRVRAMNSAGAGSYAQVDSIGDDPPPPPPPDPKTSDFDFGKIAFTGVCI